MSALILAGVARDDAEAARIESACARAGVGIDDFIRAVARGTCERLDAVSVKLALAECESLGVPVAMVSAVADHEQRPDLQARVCLPVLRAIVR